MERKREAPPTSERIAEGIKDIFAHAAMAPTKRLATRRSKIMGVDEALDLIKDGDTMALSCLGGVLVPKMFLKALEKRFLETGHPRDMTLMWTTTIGFGTGVFGIEEAFGLENFAHEGMVKRLVGGNITNWYPFLHSLVLEDKVECYMFPLGVVHQQFREIARRGPGLITRMGLHTACDPRYGGGKCNQVTREEMVEVVIIGGEEYLRYKPFPVNVTIIRGSTGDEDGNISIEDEVQKHSIMEAALAAKGSGGKVIVQVRRAVARETINPKMVEIPGIFVDAVVVDPEQWQMEGLSRYEPGMLHYRIVPPPPMPMPLNEDKVLSRRAAMELKPGDVVGLGFGLPWFNTSLVLREEDIQKFIHISIEHGSLGGECIGSAFHYNPTSIVDSASLMDFYDGSGQDVSLMGFAEVDKEGNVNTSKMGNLIMGPGGAPNIATNTKKLLWAGNFTYGGLKLEVRDGKVNILQEGRRKKFVNKVEEITWSGPIGVKKGQQVYFITERAVLKLEERGMVVKEIAPGIDLKKDIVEQSEFELIVADDLKEMDPRLFGEESLGLEAKMWAELAQG